MLEDFEYGLRERTLGSLRFAIRRAGLSQDNRVNGSGHWRTNWRNYFGRNGV